MAFRRVIGDQRGEATNLNHLGHVLYELGKYDVAESYLEQALSIAHVIGARRHEAEGLSYLGLAFEGLGRLANAAQSYSAALQLHRDIGQLARAMDDLAGLVRVAVIQGDLSAARVHTEEILAWLTEHGVGGIDEPLGVYRTCIHALEMCGEPERAQKVLENAYRLLMERADKIDSSSSRCSFLENVRVNREISTAWEARRRQQKISSPSASLMPMQHLVLAVKAPTCPRSQETGRRGRCATLAGWPDVPTDGERHGRSAAGPLRGRGATARGALLVRGDVGCGRRAVQARPRDRRSEAHIGRIGLVLQPPPGELAHPPPGRLAHHAQPDVGHHQPGGLCRQWAVPPGLVMAGGAIGLRGQRPGRCGR